MRSRMKKINLILKRTSIQLKLTIDIIRQRNYYTNMFLKAGKAS